MAKTPLNKLIVQTEDTIKVRRGNQSSIRIVRNPIHHDRMKHVEIDCHSIIEKIEINTTNLSCLHINQGSTSTKALVD